MALHFIDPFWSFLFIPFQINEQNIVMKFRKFNVLYNYSSLLLYISFFYYLESFV